MKAPRVGLWAAGALTALALGPASATAAMITYAVSGSGSGNAGPVAAQAVFTTSTGSIQIVLSNQLAASALGNVGQGVSDLIFTLSNAPGTQGTLTASGQQGNITSTPQNGGTVAYTSGTPGRFIGQGGGTFGVSGSTITLETVGSGSGAPQMIIPFMTNGGTYTGVNNGFDSQNPFTIGPGTFTLNFSGITANTTVTAASFSFGTRPDTTLTGSVVPNSVPEPSTLVGAATAVVFGLGYGWRRRSRAA